MPVWERVKACSLGFLMAMALRSALGPRVYFRVLSSITAIA